MNLQYENTSYEGGFCLCRLHRIPRDSIIKSFLHLDEQKYYYNLKFEKRKISYLLGRYAAKKAISLLVSEKPYEINIEYDVFNNPVIKGVNSAEGLEISISHSNELGCAIVFPDYHPMGIDIEYIDPNNVQVIKKELSDKEIDILKNKIPLIDNAVQYTILWTIKEALSKIFKTGLMAPFAIYEISEISGNNNYLISRYKNFIQYKAVSIIVNQHIITMTMPYKTKFKLLHSSLSSVSG